MEENLILTVTAATDVPVLALSDTTTKIQERKKMHLMNVNQEQQQTKVARSGRINPTDFAIPLLNARLNTDWN